VVSIEASPDVLPFLMRTHSACSRETWKVVGVAVAGTNGETAFWTGGPANSAFDGLRDTGRCGSKHRVRVPVRTLDDIWRECDRPAVSVVKMDIEGGEYLALEGAKDLISAKQPTFIIEWFEKNLRPYGISAETLLDFCAAVGYAIYAVPGLIPISGPAILRLAMTQTWTFALIPNTPAE
jgi:FkbM family methyltransferase